MPEIDPRDSRYIPPDGPVDARIFVLGESGGKNEHLQKKGFIGQSGKILFGQLLLPIGIPRSKCRVFNVVPIRPPDNKISKLKSLNINVANCMNDARAEIEKHPRDMIIAVGDLALQCCTGEKGIMKWHGSLMKGWNGTWVFPMIHPAACIREFKLVTLCRMDMHRLKFFLENPDYDSIPRVLHTPGRTVSRTIKTSTHTPARRSPDEYIHAIKAAVHADRISIDIETAFNTISVFGFATSPYEAWSIPFTGVFSPNDEARLISALGDLMDRPIPKITQNGIYDCTYLAEKWHVQVRGHVWDTMLMHHCLYSELRHSLGALTNQYTFDPYYKDMSKDTTDPNYREHHWEYNALDAAVTYDIWDSMLKELDNRNLTNFYLKHYVPLSSTLARVQRRGIPIDLEEKKRLRDQVDNELTTKRHELNQLVGHEVPKDKGGSVSNPAVVKLLYEELGLPVQRDRLTGSRTAKEAALRTLMRNRPDTKDILQLILDIRGQAKLRSTYLHDKLESPDGRVRCSYNIAGDSRKPDSKGGTPTGRLSSSADPFGYGTNLQNQPSSTKSMFRAPEGWKFFQLDLSAAESYIVAWCSGDERMLDVLTNHRLFRDGAGDKVWMHEETGHILTGLPREEIVGEIRQLAKRVRHGWSYNMKERTLTDTVNNDMPDFPFDYGMAKECIAKLNMAHPGVVLWWRAIKDMVYKQRMIKNCFGRERVILGRMDDVTFRSAYSTLPQGEVSDHLYLCLTDINKFCEEQAGELGEERAYVIGTVHDSIVGLAEEDFLPDVVDYSIARMEEPLPREREGFQLRIPVEAKVGQTWKECV